MQAVKTKRRKFDDATHRFLGAPRRNRKAELLVFVRSGDELVGVRLNAGGDADENGLHDAGPTGRIGNPNDLLEGVDDDVPHAGSDGGLDLGHRLVVAMEGEVGARHTGAQSYGEFAAGGHIDPEALLGHPPQNGRGAQGLGRIGHLARAGSCVGLIEGTSPRAGVDLIQYV